MGTWVEEEIGFDVLKTNITGVLPYMGYIGTWGPKGYGFSAVLAINRVSTVFFIINGSCFCTLVFNRVFFLEEATFLSLSKRTIDNHPSRFL